MAIESHANSPCVLMFIYTALYLEVIEDWFWGSPFSDTLAIRQDLGVLRYVVHRDAETSPPDISDMPRTLTALDDVAVDIGFSYTIIVKLIALLNETLKEHDASDSKRAITALQERTDLMFLRNEDLGEHVKNMRNNVQSMVQMVSPMI
jgi:hypothetical protein